MSALSSGLKEARSNQICHRQTVKTDKILVKNNLRVLGSLQHLSTSPHSSSRPTKPSCWWASRQMPWSSEGNRELPRRSGRSGQGLEMVRWARTWWTRPRPRCANSMAEPPSPPSRGDSVSRRVFIIIGPMGRPSAVMLFEIFILWILKMKQGELK